MTTRQILAVGITVHKQPFERNAHFAPCTTQALKLGLVLQNATGVWIAAKSLCVGGLIHSTLANEPKCQSGLLVSRVVYTPWLAPHGVVRAVSKIFGL